MFAVRLPLMVELLCLSASVVLATPAGSSQTQPRPAERVQLPPEAVITVLGHEVKGPHGTVVGQITNLLVDRVGQPLAAVLDYGGFLGVGRRKIAVAWTLLQFPPRPANDIILTLTMDQLKGFPEYQADRPILMASPPGESSPAPDR